ncbi:MAG: sodium:solute symporter [Bacteroidota bacterium]
MSSNLIFFIIVAYFGMLVAVSFYTARGADTHAFFTANKRSPWWLVAFGMIGTSISGVTFISVPGEVGSGQFAYFQFVLGNLVGYFIIATVLLPLYYRLNLISIYTYLEKRFGFWSYKTGAFFFLVSRTVGAAFRLFLAAAVLQIGLFDDWGVPFEINVLITIVLIWVITFKGGIKTIIWTDSLQTIFLVSAVIISVVLIGRELGLSAGGLLQTVKDSDYSRVFFFDNPKDSKYFFKKFFAGMFIAIAMTGLDQDLMQKNLTCKNLKEAQKNMFSFCLVFVVINLLFLTLGALLYLYSTREGISLPARADYLFPTLALKHFGALAGISFLLGIIAASYASADSALAALTTSFCIDFLEFGKRPETERLRLKTIVHLSFSFLLFIVILIFNKINDQSVVSAVFTAAGYTYGPLLGLYAFGLFTKLPVRDRFVPFICLASPILCYIINTHSQEWLNGYQFGFELLILNGALTFLGLLLVSKRLPVETIVKM